MRLGVIGAVIVALGVLVSACGPQPPATVDATVVPPATPDSPTATQVLPTVAPLARPTLPPTWTPTDLPSPTPSATPTVNPTLDTFLRGSYDTSLCENFGEVVGQNPETVPVGEAVQVFWRPAETAVVYDITLYDQANTPVFQTMVEDTQYTFDAELFDTAQSWGWLVTPFNAEGVQVCPARGSTFDTQLVG